jgi:hypothetical protein
MLIPAPAVGNDFGFTVLVLFISQQHFFKIRLIFAPLSVLQEADFPKIPHKIPQVFIISPVSPSNSYSTYCSTIIIIHEVSPGAGTKGQTVDAVPSRLTLTPSEGKKAMYYLLCTVKSVSTYKLAFFFASECNNVTYIRHFPSGLDLHFLYFENYQKINRYIDVS